VEELYLAIYSSRLRYVRLDPLKADIKKKPGQPQANVRITSSALRRLC